MITRCFTVINDVIKYWLMYCQRHPLTSSAFKALLGVLQKDPSTPTWKNFSSWNGLRQGRARWIMSPLSRVVTETWTVWVLSTPEGISFKHRPGDLELDSGKPHVRMCIWETSDQRGGRWGPGAAEFRSWEATSRGSPFGQPCISFCHLTFLWTGLPQSEIFLYFSLAKSNTPWVMGKGKTERATCQLPLPWLRFLLKPLNGLCRRSCLRFICSVF